MASFIDNLRTIECPRVALRALGPRDIPFLLQHYQIPEISKYTLLYLPDLDTAETFYRSSINYQMGSKFRVIIELKSLQIPIGVIYLGNWSTEHRFAEIGYDLEPDFWRQGLITEALTGFIQFAFKSLGLHRIEATTNPTNLASARVLRRLGFAREGIFREKYWVQGDFHDEVAYALLAQERPPS